MLTTNKREETYEHMLSVLKQIEPTLNPTDVTVDFEKAAMNAIHSVFPEAEIHGCNFHFGQNIWRNVQGVGLQSAYSNDDEFAFNIKLLPALAYVPKERVQDAYDELMNTEFFDEDGTSTHVEAIQQLVAYFQDTYISRKNRKGKNVQPMYPIELWNVFEATLCGNYILI